MTQTVLTALGFQRKRYDDYLTEQQAYAKELFGADVNLSDTSPLGQWCKLNAYQHAEANELAEQVWLSAHIDSAEGVALDYAVKKYGLRREQAQAAYGVVNVTADVGTTIGVGALTVETADGIQFVNTTGGTSVSGTLTLTFTALETGPAGNVPANTITVIYTPLAGVNAVNNPAVMIEGKNVETDDRLRERYYATMGRGGSSTTDGVRVAMLEVDGVRAAVVLENNLDTWSGGSTGVGYPPHSIAPVVLGGDADTVAAAIHSKKAAGIRSYGDVTRTVIDKSGFPQAIGFSYATAAEIYVNVLLSKNAVFPANGARLVQDEIIRYIGGTNADNETYLGLGMAAPVVLSQIIGAIIRNVAGIVDLSVELKKGADGSFAAANVSIGAVEVADTSADKEVVTIG